jgi:hypothetical protein
MSLEPLLSHIEANGEVPPVDRWNPDFCGDMDLVIRSDGVWVHEGTPIGRPRLVRLLSTVLRRESDGDYYLVTPVEKMRVRVEDRPFLVVDAERHDKAGSAVWWLTTNVGDRVCLDEQRRLLVSMTPDGEPVPEVAIRFGLSARLNRNVFYRLVDIADQRQQGKDIELGLSSAGYWQPLGRIDTELL